MEIMVNRNRALTLATRGNAEESELGHRMCRFLESCEAIQSMTITGEDAEMVYCFLAVEEMLREDEILPDTVETETLTIHHNGNPAEVTIEYHPADCYSDSTVRMEGPNGTHELVISFGGTRKRVRTDTEAWVRAEMDDLFSARSV